MSCQWCEEEKDLLSLCDVDDHQICKQCYETYNKQYPKRVKGCPYCKGIEEIPVIIELDRSDTQTVHYESRYNIGFGGSRAQRTVRSYVCATFIYLGFGIICFWIFRPVEE